MLEYSNIIGFDWDEHNLNKNWLKHSVHFTECEEIFFNEPLITFSDEKHSENELRYFCLGQTNVGRKLFCVFTIRNNKMRVISARDMSIKEKVIYEKNT